MKALVLIISTLSVLFTINSRAEAPAAAATCVACHGEQGKSNNPIWPNLAGQKEAYLVKQLHDFKSGQRKDPLMTSIALPLSDSDIQSLAKYFSEQK
ncbi:MAG: cytochrome c [Bdellovibrionales bacterium]|nr:cytochrome c [Bdellovibrionales bacterium]